MTDQKQTQELVPIEFYEHLSSYDVRNPYYKKLLDEELADINEFAHAEGLKPVLLEDIFPQSIEAVPEEETPAGYKSAVIVKNGATVNTKKVKNIINSLKNAGSEETVDLTRLVTDAGVPVGVCDLRPLMTSNVRKGGPEQKSDQNRLDKKVLHDIKSFVETGNASNTVVVAPGVNYTRLGDTKIRAYWMPVPISEENEGITVARIADCADSVAAEAALYKRVFGAKL